MTEAEWLAATDPTPMLEFVWLNASNRKRRLVACGCCRHHWQQVSHPASRRAVEVAELYADDLASLEMLTDAFQVGFWWPTDTAEDWKKHSLDWGCACAAAPRLEQSTTNFVLLRKAHAEAITQCGLLRDIFNPFRPVIADPKWLTSAVVGLAQAIYAERAFDRMPILGDALEEGGCDVPDVLNHCRQPGEHVRGCWLIDTLTGRT